MNIREFRQRYPQYNDIPDNEVAQKFHAQFYPDIPEKEFRSRFFGGVYPEGTLKPHNAFTNLLRKENPTLEIGGGMAGGAMGTATSPATGPAGPIIGSGLGTGFAGQLKRILRYAMGMEEQPPLLEQFKETGYDITAGVAGEGVGRAGQIAAAKTLAPYAKEAPELMTKIMQNQLPLRPSTIIPSKTARAVEWVGDAFITGKAKVTKAAQTLQKTLTSMSDDVKRSMPLAGKTLKELNQIKDDAYKVFQSNVPIDNTGMINMKNTVDVLNKQKVNFKGDARQVMEIYSKKGMSWTPDDVNQYQAQLGEIYKKSPAIREELTRQLESDIGKTASEALVTAKEAYKDILRFKEMRFVEKLINRSTQIDRNDPTGGRVFKPQTFVDRFEQNKEKIKNILPEDTYENLLDFVEINKMAIRDITKAQGGELAGKARLGIGAGGLAQAGYQIAHGDVVGAGLTVAPFGFSYGVAKSMMNPKGYVKKWLTTGFTPQTALSIGKEAIKAGVIEEETRKPGMLVPRFTR